VKVPVSEKLMNKVMLQVSYGAVLIIFKKIEEYFVCLKKDSFELFSSFMIQTNVGREIGLFTFGWVARIDI
jgi:hypothetical protein